MQTSPYVHQLYFQHNIEAQQQHWMSPSSNIVQFEPSSTIYGQLSEVRCEKRFSLSTMNKAMFAFHNIFLDVNT